MLFCRALYYFVEYVSHFWHQRQQLLRFVNDVKAPQCVLQVMFLIRGHRYHRFHRLPIRFCGKDRENDKLFARWYIFVFDRMLVDLFIFTFDFFFMINSKFIIHLFRKRETKRRCCLTYLTGLTIAANF